jgi:hypothetical protein
MMNATKPDAPFEMPDEARLTAEIAEFAEEKKVTFLGELCVLCGKGWVLWGL